MAAQRKPWQVTCLQKYYPLQKIQEDWALLFNARMSGIVWVIFASYNWLTVTLETMNQLKTLVVQSIWSGELDDFDLLKMKTGSRLADFMVTCTAISILNTEKALGTLHIVSEGLLTSH